jgi:hypothetical protein
VSALDLFIPTFLVYPRVRINSKLLDYSLDMTVVYVNSSGLMEEYLFLKPIKCSHVTKEKPTLLILEGNAIHKFLEAIELARKSGIVKLTNSRRARQNCRRLIYAYADFSRTTLLKR